MEVAIIIRITLYSISLERCRKQGEMSRKQGEISDRCPNKQLVHSESTTEKTPANPVCVGEGMVVYLGQITLGAPDIK